MMHAVAIDTLAFARKLKSSGFNEKQAEAQAETINAVLMDFQDKRLEELATKSDLKAEISKTETKLIKWGVTLMFAQLAGVAAIIKLFL